MKLLPYSVVLLSVALALGGCADRVGASVGDPSGGDQARPVPEGEMGKAPVLAPTSSRPMAIQAPMRAIPAAIHAMKKAHAFAKSIPLMSAKMANGYLLKIAAPLNL